MKKTAITLLTILLVSSMAGCLTAPREGDLYSNQTGDSKTVVRTGAVGMLVRIPLLLKSETTFTESGDVAHQKWDVNCYIRDQETPDPTLVYAHNFDELVGQRVGDTEWYGVNGNWFRAKRTSFGEIMKPKIDRSEGGVYEVKSEDNPKIIIKDMVSENAEDELNTILPLSIKVTTGYTDTLSMDGSAVKIAEIDTPTGVQADTMLTDSFTLDTLLRFKVQDLLDNDAKSLTTEGDLYVPFSLQEKPEKTIVEIVGSAGKGEMKWKKFKAVEKTWLDLGWITEKFGLGDIEICSVRRIKTAHIIMPLKWDTPTKEKSGSWYDKYTYNVI